MKQLLSVLLLLITIGIRVAAQDQDNEDVQLWPDVTVGFKLNPATTLNFFGTVRPGRHFAGLVSEQLGTAMVVRISDYFSITPNYRHIWSQPTATRHSQENRYFLDVTSRLPLRKGFSLSDRNRGEVREINDQVSWRYRNRIQLEKAFGWHDLQLTAYIAEEFHFDSRYHAWNRKQFWAGTRVPLSKHFTLDLHYSRNMDTRAQPGYLHLIGMFSRLEF